LLGAFAASLLVVKLFGGDFDFSLAGRIAMSVMLIFTGIGHFAFAEGMTLMLPSIVPFKKVVVYLTGVIEVAAAIGLLIPRLQNLTPWLLILFFFLILPANINAAINKIDYQKGTTDGNGLSYLWFRVPLQVFFIAWVYFFAVKLF
jgi:uncharacterized membrane protein